MQHLYRSIFLFLSCFLLITSQTFSQSKYKNLLKKKTATAVPANTPVNKPAADTPSVYQQQFVPKQAVTKTAQPPTALFSFDTGDAYSGLQGIKALPPLRDNFVVDKTTSSARDRRPLPYEILRDEDVLYSEFVWREINTHEKINNIFSYNGKDELNRDQRFLSVLVSALLEDSITAFDPVNDKFTTPMSREKILNIIQGNLDTISVTDPVSGQTNFSITRAKALNFDSVYTFRLKEQWVFDRESSRMFVRIIGIAPIAKVTVIQGKPTVDRTLFWIYYPDLRTKLARYEVYNTKNMYSRMTWEEIFEGRMFNSYVVKSSMDNPADQYLKSYIKDPLFRLLEGEKITAHIFEYEQSVWSY